MIRLGIVGCSEIAFRRFMPAVQHVEGILPVVVAEEYAPEKLEQFCGTYGLEGERSFEAMIAREDLDAIYIPQPPALHFKWARLALEHGKHVLVEKPSTTTYEDSKTLCDLASSRGLALHENYMFQYHSQIAAARRLIEDGTLGDITMIRVNFGFPLRASNDFRYNKALGGGALLDAGGYTIRLASLLLGEGIRVDAGSLRTLPGYEVDMLGSGTLSDENGMVCQVAFGMNCKYQCSLEIWGSKARLYTGRILTAPPDVNPVFFLERQEGTEEIKLPCDSSFEHSIEAFLDEIHNPDSREKMYKNISLQAKLVSDLRTIAQQGAFQH